MSTESWIFCRYKKDKLESLFQWSSFLIFVCSFVFNLLAHSLSVSSSNHINKKETSSVNNCYPKNKAEACVDMKQKLMKLLLLLQFLSLNSLSLKHSSAKPNAKITVMGLVYCDVCSNNSFSKHSYFIPGIEVRITCRFNTASSRTREMITFSANRTTNELGLYKLDITSLEGLACAAEAEKDSLMASCQASLIGSSSDSCNVPGHKTTTDQVVFKSKRSNLCVYGFTALNFRPLQKNLDLCGKQ